MKIKLTASWFTLSLLLSSCTSQQLYQEIQNQNKSRCKPELNRDAQAECLFGSDTDYLDYKRERDALMNRKDD